jgi:hypothetical protein
MALVRRSPIDSLLAILRVLDLYFIHGRRNQSSPPTYLGRIRAELSLLVQLTPAPIIVALLVTPLCS